MQARTLALQSNGNDLMGTLVRDIRYRIRRLWNRPAFAVACSLSLAFGIGACAVIFSIFNAVLLRQLPYPKADRLVEVRQVTANARRTNLCDTNFDPEVASPYE
jgi:putative ABC transport system permease protein